MKKTMGLFLGVVALLVVAVPAMARDHRDPRTQTSSTANMVMVTNESAALANSGLNRLNGSGTLRTGDAYADSVNVNTVNVSVFGCCEEDEPDCCRQDRRHGCQPTQEPSTRVTNMVMLSNRSVAVANTGLNVVTGTNQLQRPSLRTHHHQPVRTGSLVTGDAGASSQNDTLVNLTVVGF